MPTFNIGPVTSRQKIASYTHYPSDSSSNYWDRDNFEVLGNSANWATGFAWYNPAEIATFAAMMPDIVVNSARVLMPESSEGSASATVGVTPLTNSDYPIYGWPFRVLEPVDRVLPAGGGYITISEDALTLLLSGNYNGLVFKAKLTPPAVSTGLYYTTEFPILSIDFSYKKSSITTSSPVEFGSTLTATITAARAEYTHKLTLSFGTQTLRKTVNADSETTHTAVFTIPRAWAEEIPDAPTGAGTLAVETLNGKTSFGTNTVSVTFNVPASMAPTPGTISYTVDNPLDVPMSKQKLIASLSGQTGKQGATIKDYMLSCEGYASNNAPLTVESIPRVPNEQQWQITITATVTDSRGMTAQTTLNVTVYAWDVPFFSSLSVRRCNSLGEVTEDGHYAKVEGVYGCFSVNNLNSIQSCTLKIVRKSTGDETSAGSLTSGVPKVIGNDTLLSNEEYVVRLTLVDEVASITYEVTVYSMAYVMHFKSGGTGVAFGQAATEDSTVRINPRWALKIGNDLDVAAILTDLMSRVDALDGGGNS